MIRRLERVTSDRRLLAKRLLDHQNRLNSISRAAAQQQQNLFVPATTTWQQAGPPASTRQNRPLAADRGAERGAVADVTDSRQPWFAGGSTPPTKTAATRQASNDVDSNAWCQALLPWKQPSSANENQSVPTNLAGPSNTLRRPWPRRQLHNNNKDRESGQVHSASRKS